MGTLPASAGTVRTARAQEEKLLDNAPLRCFRSMGRRTQLAPASMDRSTTLLVKTSGVGPGRGRASAWHACSLGRGRGQPAVGCRNKRHACVHAA
jgi:hypothetical protein